ncbi:MAG TPA: DUF2950 domain-containing protein [Gemmatimonadaceae bacterium]|nr:DUF2950 domain-containing protein [Gemmatimonadaceae bacterium]
MYRSFPGVQRLTTIGLTLVVASCARQETDDPNQLSFSTPDSAVAALAAALETRDLVAMRRLLGPETEGLVSSGDTARDRSDREGFLARYRARHEIVAGGPDDAMLQVGDDEWPLPVPLLRRNGRWRFDGDAAVNELLARRIGANELRTIDVMRGFVDAQQEYAAVGHDGDAPGIYARVLRSDPGRQNGLYWEVSAGEAPSPAGPFLAAASAEGYKASASANGPAPYHGYVYRMLFSQGPAADGGAREYVADGKLTGGFSLLAYPAEYGETGVMTFMVNQDGLVWQRNLGPKTGEVAAAITQFDPDSSWTPIPRDTGSP